MSQLGELDKKIFKEIVEGVWILWRKLGFAGGDQSSFWLHYFVRQFWYFYSLIFNSGASHHMTFDKNILTNCSST